MGAFRDWRWPPCFSRRPSEIHLESGHLDRALVHAGQAVDLCRKNNENFFLAAAMIDLGRVAAAADRMKFDEALKWSQQGLSMLDELKIRAYYPVGLLGMGELCVDGGRKEAGREHVRNAEKMFREMGMDDWLGEAKEVLARM